MIFPLYMVPPGLRLLCVFGSLFCSQFCRNCVSCFDLAIELVRPSGHDADRRGAQTRYRIFRMLPMTSTSGGTSREHARPCRRLLLAVLPPFSPFSSAASLITQCKCLVSLICAMRSSFPITDVTVRLILFNIVVAPICCAFVAAFTCSDF